MNNLPLLAYLILLPWTRHSPLPSLGVQVSWADVFFPLVMAPALLRYRRGAALPPLLPYEKVALLWLVVLLVNVVCHPLGARPLLKLLGLAYAVSIMLLLPRLGGQTGASGVFRVSFWAALILSATGACAFAAASWLQAPNALVFNDPNALRGAANFWRLRSIGQTPNMLAAYLYGGVVSALWFRAEANSPAKRRLCWVGAALMVIAIILCKSRVIFGALIALAVWTQARWRFYGALRRTWAAGLFLCTAAAGLIVAASMAFVVAPVSVGISRRGPKLSWNREKSPYACLNLLALSEFAQRPLLGLGLGSFKSRIRDGEGMLRRHFPDFTADAPPGCFVARDPHSTYQGLLAETGLPGFIMAAAILAAALVCLGPPLAGPGLDPLRRLALKAGLWGFAAHGFYLDILSLRYFWCFCGCLGLFLASARLNGAVRDVH